MRAVMNLKFFLSLFLLTFSLLPGPSCLGADKPSAAITQKAMDLSNFMSQYYLKPTPSLVGKAMRDFSDLDASLKPNASAPFAAFLGILMSKHPDKVPGWIKEMTFKDQTDRGVICYALWIANNDVCREQLKVVARGMEGKRKEAILALVDKKPDNLKTMPIRTPADLDKLWSAFVASGDRIYVERVMSVLPEINGSGERIIMGGAAQWSLSANVKQHALVKQICIDELKKHPEYKPFLKDLKLN